MKKSNKIMVVVEPDIVIRRKLIARLVVKLGFARTPSDASKIIRTSPYDFDLATDYFILADNYDLRESSITTQRLYELATKGIAVVIGLKRIPSEHEFFCQAFFPVDI